MHWHNLPQDNNNPRLGFIHLLNYLIITHNSITLKVLVKQHQYISIIMGPYGPDYNVFINYNSGITHKAKLT